MSERQLNFAEQRAETKRPVVFVHVLTYNSEKTIRKCLASVIDQSNFEKDKDFFIYVTDNASADETCSTIKQEFGDNIELIESEENLGFCTAHNNFINFALRKNADYILVLNPDVKLEANCLSHLVQTLEQDSSSGVSSPKLYRADESLTPVVPKSFDSTGMFITPSIRHFDRGSNEIDCGQYDEDRYVFGASGAAMLARAEFIRDVSFTQEDGYLEFFDEDFFAYREDADLAWRAQWLGWKTHYTPQAVAYHTRVVLPENRKELSSKINRYGVRNRFLLQLNNYSLAANLKCLFPQTIRNLAVVAACFSVEPSSIKGLFEVLGNIRQRLKKRAELLKRRRVSPGQIAKWFSKAPYTENALKVSDTKEKVESLSIIIINFNSGKRLHNCLRTIKRSLPNTKAKIKVKVVDNSSNDVSFALAVKGFSNQENFSFHSSNRNLGFAGAINKAAKEVETDTILILNPDIEVNTDALNELIKTLEDYSELAAVAPVLVSEYGKAQTGFYARALPTLGSTLAELFFLHRIWPTNPWTKKYLLSDNYDIEQANKRKLESPTLVEQPAGAALMVRTLAFKMLNGFDSSFWPAWFEDVDFCKRLISNGFKLAIVPRANVIHEGGYSAKKLSKKEFGKIWYRNQRRYWGKHGTNSEKVLLNLLMPVALFIRSSINLITQFFKRKTEAVDSIPVPTMPSNKPSKLKKAV